MSSVLYPLSLLGLYLLYTLGQRIFYLIWILNLSQEPLLGCFSAFFYGSVFDLICGAVFFTPVLLVYLLRPSRTQKYLTVFFSFVPFLLFILGTIAEYFFFQEFQSRFNFIAVDYLLYTRTVFDSAFESYPVPQVAALLVSFLGFTGWCLWKLFKSFPSKRRDTFPKAYALLGAVFFSFILSLSWVSEERLLAKLNYWPKEIAKNSIYTLFSAYLKNSIDFKDFYLTLDEREVSNLIPKNISSRSISATETLKKWNVVLIVMESMSARFMQSYGNKEILTPNLDRFAQNGLFFSKVYATGTRTVRGLEALMLSLPPTPGQSILRRPHSDGLFTLGTPFQQNGYSIEFVYGGYSAFDNMKSWFSSNGFGIFDRTDFDSKKTIFSNAWGVSDEDLYREEIQHIDELHTRGKLFFHVILNTSNHRPYTYPPDRVAIPSKQSREGAVQYSDYAIGKFIEDAKAKPWFDQTLFVFVADHNASVAGGSDIPVRDYLIPVIFYNPKLMKPNKIDKLGSQIDVGPTLLGLLGFSYQSSFFGVDLLKETPNRSFMATYQRVGYLEPGEIIVLSPVKTLETTKVAESFEPLSRTTEKNPALSSLSPTAKRGIALYQTASEMFHSGKLKKTIHLGINEHRMNPSK